MNLADYTETAIKVTTLREAAADLCKCRKVLGGHNKKCPAPALQERASALVSGVEEERRLMAERLHAAINGDFLVAAGRGHHNSGHDVALSDAHAAEVVWWAVDALCPSLKPPGSLKTSF